ncbi:Galanin receptor type 1 [Ameca splendens]|uniref:Galanin receptor type 1 n=1 Tax=Ameca splendens TaxID=208324 RepID=A0ABV0YPN6_9TELE
MMNLSESVWLLGEQWNITTLEEDGGKRRLFGIGTENFITLLVFLLIFTLGVLGNSMVITVLARSKPGKPRSTTNIFILNLSIADLSYLLVCIPFQSTIYIMNTWVLGAFICKFSHYFFTVSMLVSIFTLSAMSVDRYIAIVHSRKSSTIRVARHALIGVVVIWILSLAMAAPIMHYQNLFHWKDNETFCWEVWPDQNQKKVYVVCTFVFGYILPLLLISFCYAKVINHLHKKLRNMSKKSEASKKKGEELGHPGGAQSRAAAPPHREEPVEVAWASIPDASWTPSSGGVPGTSHREEAQGTAQDTLEGLCLSAGLGTPWAPLEELEGVSGERDVWASLLSLLPPRPGPG